MAHEHKLGFWLRWVLANAASEAIGLSAVLIVGFGVLGPRLERLGGAWPAVLALAAGVLLGIFEGLLVGGAQGAVLRRRLPGLPLRRWIVATVIGAMVAWGLGMLPSTMMGGEVGATQPAGPPEWLTYVMAAGLGLVAGVFLALPQWVVLRSLPSGVRRPALWLPANALAWLVGMPVVFLGMGAIPAGATILQAAPIVVAATAAAGAVVGAIHGLILANVMLTDSQAVLWAQH